MSTRYKNGSHYENHQRAAELHDGAAHAHLAASVSHDQQDHQNGGELSRQALERSREAHQHTKQAHDPRNHPGHREQEDIAILAYRLWEARGRPSGSPDEDWFHAAQQLRREGQGVEK